MLSIKTFMKSLLFAAAAICLPACVWAQSNRVYVIEITGEVDPGMTPYVHRVLAEANDERAAAVVLHVYTFGGRIDVATDIKDAIYDSKVPVIAYIDKRAISAGAFIALATNKVVMAPSATIGAVTPVSSSGEKASEKVVSFMRSEMRAIAERNGRDPKIAEAMVDETIDLGDTTIKKAGKLLTLTTSEAARVGYCDTVATTLEGAVAAAGFPKAEIISTDFGWSETMIRFLSHPVMNSILIMLGLGGIFYTVKTGHFSAITGVGIMAITLFFGAQFMTDMASFIELVMFVAGVVLIMLEVFVVPGFGVTGISGALLLVGSLFLSLINNFDLMTVESIAIPLYTLAASFVGLAILIGLMVKYLPHSSAFNRFVLTAAQPASAGFVSAPDYHDLLGYDGAAVTTLRPAGVAQLGSERFDVITDGEFISAGEPVKVVRVEGRKIIVRKV